jgi:hypothetical protein
VRATVTDLSGVASVTLYYRTGKGGFARWGSLKEGAAGSYVVGFGSFSVVGIYEYRIVAVDGLGNANCATTALSRCPGGTTTVIASR